MVFRLIAPQWAIDEGVIRTRVLEGEYTQERIEELNVSGYNVYFLPNYPSQYDPSKKVDGSQIDTFNFVFVDMDLKEGKYATKHDFLLYIQQFPDLTPTHLVDSGNGVHAYWQVTDLDAMSYLKLQRRLMRKFNTDEAVGQIFQLMRVPGTINTKVKDDPKLCEYISQSDSIYTCEEMDKALPPLTVEDEEYCKRHFDKTYSAPTSTTVSDKLPPKFATLLRENKEVKDIWSGAIDDRSKGDYRLGHIMFASGFTRDEAMSVLVNAGKALSRAPAHRMSYAENIVDKIWTFEEKKTTELSSSVKDILARGEETLSGTRFACHPLVDDTVAGFRLGHVFGLVAGSGVGKTAMAMNMFRWFTERNPEYEHFFIPLEQVDSEIAVRWRTICQGDTRLHDKVHILSNYGPNGEFRHLSLDDIKDYMLDFQKRTGKKIGTCVIDHIGALKKQSKNGENQALVDICHQLKSFAVETNTMVIIQSQSPREKAGQGDLELNKDAAYGTVFFEAYVDWLMTIWQPLKRAYPQGAPTIMAFKYCKIRHKKQGQDKIQEDVCYQLFFDPKTETLRELTQDEEDTIEYWQNRCINIRKRDKKTDLVPYQSRRSLDGDIKGSKDSEGTGRTNPVH